MTRPLSRPQLIAYADRLAGDLAGLRKLLHTQLAGAFGGVHVLPFYHPFDGADAGFDPIDHTEVDQRLGSWDDVAGLGTEYDLTADLIVNHISSSSPQFLDWQSQGSDSPYDGMFLTLGRVFPDGPGDQLAQIFRPRPGQPFTSYTIAGEERQVWTTFTRDQIDLDLSHPAAWSYLLTVLDRLAGARVRMVRLDAVGYAAKKPGTSCFMIPETFELIDVIGAECERRGMAVLVEIHSHHRHQVEIAGRVDRVYDFALPPLVLHAIHRGDAQPLRTWLRASPRNCVTVLDTHDGIGIVDVAPSGALTGLLSADDIDALVEVVHDATGGRSREATGQAASNLDLYQINTTFYEALGSDDTAHFLARLIQVLCPGIPQVYYAGLLAAPNQMDLLRRTGVGRDINRPYYDAAALADAIAEPVVEDTLNLLRWRTANAELFDGSFEVHDAAATDLALRWSAGGRVLDAAIDVAAQTFRLELDGGVLSSPGDFGP